MAKKISTEEFKAVVEAAECELLSPYVGAREKVKIRCKHGHEYLVAPYSFKTGRRCLVCSGKCPIAAKEDFEQRVEQVDYELLSPYVKAHEKVTLRCNRGHEYKVQPSKFKHGDRCPQCAKNLSFKSIYIMRDLNNPNIAKIGVSFNPWRRCKEVTIASNGIHEFEVFHQEDMSFEVQKAGDIENIILSAYHEDKVYESSVFNGSTEILKVSPERLKQHIQQVVW